jgi:hypothetical protein
MQAPIGSADDTKTTNTKRLHQKMDNTTPPDPSPKAADQGGIMMTAVRVLPIAKIDVGTRLRSLSEEQVVALADTIAEVGLLHPIVVTPSKVLVRGFSESGWSVVAGAHRLEACRRLGQTEIAATIVEGSDLERQLMEVDENLIGTVLTPSERALFTARRKALYEALHPETRPVTERGGPGRGKNGRKVCDGTDGETAKDRFTADTATKTGRSERAVQLDAARGERIDEEVLEEIRGTELDKGVVLDELAATPREEQRDKVEEIRQGRATLEELAKATAEKLWISKNKARYLHKIDGLSVEAMEAAAERGWLDHIGLLCAAAKEATPEAQVAYIVAFEEERRRELEAERAKLPRREPEPRTAAPPDSVPAPAAEPVPAASATPLSVEELLARARAAKETYDQTMGSLPEPEVLGVSKAEWKRRNAARQKTHMNALAEQERCIALAVAARCRDFAEDLYDIARSVGDALEEVLGELLDHDQEQAEGIAEDTRLDDLAD